MPSKLDQLREMTDVVADTGDIEAIKRFQPQDATTNPSLLLKAAAIKQYEPLIRESIRWSKSSNRSSAEQLSACCDRLAVAIGCEILKLIPGRVSTEVDSPPGVERARRLINLYEQQDVSPQRVLIKIAATWEGIKAAEVLEKEGVNCNLTLMFSFAQAAAAAEAGATLISPFVGRILDWYVANTDNRHYAPAEDPGVISVSQIYNYLKHHRYATVVMGASFRNTGEIEELAGCDRLTISPQLLEELDADQGTLQRKLSPENSQAVERRVEAEHEFRWSMNEDAMATEKLAEGIRRFAADQIELEQLLTGF